MRSARGPSTRASGIGSTQTNSLRGGTVAKVTGTSRKSSKNLRQRRRTSRTTHDTSNVAIDLQTPQNVEDTGVTDNHTLRSATNSHTTPDETGTEVIAWKINQFAVDCRSTGITCTPDGNIVVCGPGSGTVTMYTQEGHKLMDLEIPEKAIPWDVECTSTHIYLTDRQANLVLVYDVQGRLVSTNKLVDKNRLLGGVSISAGQTFITRTSGETPGETSDNIILQIDLCDHHLLPNQIQFAPGLKLNNPLAICAQADEVAVVSTCDQCVHVMTTSGELKYTYGTPGKWGWSYNQLDYPTGVVFDKQHNLLIVDFNNSRVCVVSDSGRLLGHIDLKKHDVCDCWAITIDNEGNLLVTCKEFKQTILQYFVVKLGYSTA